MITIGKPYIEKVATGTRLCAKITEDALVKTLWYEVDDDYAQYLSDRSDAFVVALLYWAMVYHHDITCEAPLTGQLHYQMQHILCPVLARNSTRLYSPKIIAPLTPEPLKTKGAVGTGCSGGIDSFHAIAEHINDDRWAFLQLTHLCVFSIGHLHESSQHPETLKLAEASFVRARNIAQRLNLECLIVRSNYNEEFPQEWLYMVTYGDMACVHALGKLFGTYFYASSGTYELELTHAECGLVAHYDVFSLPNLSTSSLALYSEGAGLMRWEKTKIVATLPETYELLNVCNDELRQCGESDGVTNRNCGYCDKCQRTLLDFEALGVIEKYAAVFDLAHYWATARRVALRQLLKRHLGKSPHAIFAWKKFKHEFTFADWWSQRKEILRRMRMDIRRLFMTNKPPRFKDPRKGTGK